MKKCGRSQILRCLELRRLQRTSYSAPLTYWLPERSSIVAKTSAKSCTDPDGLTLGEKPVALSSRMK